MSTKIQSTRYFSTKVENRYRKHVFYSNCGSVLRKECSRKRVVCRCMLQDNNTLNVNIIPILMLLDELMKDGI